MADLLHTVWHVVAKLAVATVAFVVFAIIFTVVVVSIDHAIKLARK